MARAIRVGALFVATCATCSLNPPGGHPRDAAAAAEADPAGALVREGGWQAVELVGKPILNGTRLTISFCPDGRVAGSAGTNRFTGSYTREGLGELNITDLATTKRYLDFPPGRMQQEQTYLDALRSVDAFELEQDALVLQARTKPMIRYIEAP